MSQKILHLSVLIAAFFAVLLAGALGVAQGDIMAALKSLPAILGLTAVVQILLTFGFYAILKIVMDEMSRGHSLTNR